MCLHSRTMFWFSVHLNGFLGASPNAPFSFWRTKWFSNLYSCPGGPIPNYNVHRIKYTRYHMTSINDQNWMVRKILASRDQLQYRQNGLRSATTQLDQAQHEGKCSIHKMYISLLPSHPRAAWKHITLHPKIHSRYRFIVWLAVHRRLAIMERLLKFGNEVPPDCVFCGQSMESFTHIFWMP